MLIYIKSLPGLFYQKYGHVYISASSNVGYKGDKGDIKATTKYLSVGFVGGYLVSGIRKKM